MMNEARKEYLWSVHGRPRGNDWTDEMVDAVVIGWHADKGYQVVHRTPFLANDLAHANKVARGVFALYLTTHGEEFEYAGD